MKKILISVSAVVFAFSFAFAGSFEKELNSAVNGGYEMELPEASPKPSESGNGPKAGPEINIFKTLDRVFGGKSLSVFPYFPGKSAGLSGGVLYKVNIDEIMNAYLETDLIFKTSRGTPVHVSAAKAVNCPGGGDDCSERNKYYFVLTKGNEHIFIRSMDIANASFFMSGKKTVNIDGDAFTFKLYVKLSNTGKSRLEVKRDGKTVLETTLNRLGDYILAKGVDLKLSSTYRMSCGYELAHNGKKVGFNSNKVLFFSPFPITEDSEVYTVPLSSISRDGVVLNSFEKNYGFSLKGNMLEIFRI